MIDTFLFSGRFVLLVLMVMTLVVPIRSDAATSLPSTSNGFPDVLWTQLAGKQPIDVKAGDITGDSNPDVVVGYSEPAILAIGSSGNVLWRFATSQWVWSVAIGDIDGDGQNDVAGFETQLPSNLYAISGSGTELWNYKLPKSGSGNQAADHIQIGDVNGDGMNEVVVGASGGDNLFIFDNLGSVLVSYGPPAGGISSVELADLANAQGDEIVFSYGFRCPPCGVQTIDGSGNLIWDFPSPVRLGQAVVGDINSDTQLEVVTTEWASGRGRKLHALDHAGNLIWTYDLPAEARAIAIGDVVGDGGLEVAVGLSAHNGLRKVLLIDGHGTLQWEFDITAQVHITGIDVGDLDGDGAGEVVVTTLGLSAATGIFAIRSDGSQLWSFGSLASDTGQTGYRDVTISDLNNDGRQDVIAIHEGLTGRPQGLVYAIETGVAGGPDPEDEDSEQANRAPVIITTPVTSAVVGQTYSYDVDAVDPDGDDLVYSLEVAPEGMAIDQTTGLMTWIPDASQVGSHEVEVVVEDGECLEGGLNDSQPFRVSVSPT